MANIGIIEYMIEQKQNGRKVVIYCAGLHGILFYHVLKTCGISVDFFLDSDSSKWGTYIVDNIRCISPNEVKAHDCAGFICVGKRYYKELHELVSKGKLFEIIPISNVIDDLILNNRKLYFEVLHSHGKQKAADIFYDLYPNKQGIKTSREMENIDKIRKKIAVYTAVFGDYDAEFYSRRLSEPFEQIYVSDRKPKGLPNYYHWIDAKQVIPDRIDSPIKRNRYIKMNPHLFLQDYDDSIYIDGNVRIEGDISGLILDSKSGISVFMHPMRECTYYEALSIVNFKRVDVEDVCRQMEKYFEEGMPLRYGLAEMPVIVREHRKEECIKVMNTWWDEFDSGSQRDQLSFMYSLWKNGLTAEDLGCLGYDVRHDGRFTFYEHVRESRNVKNRKIRS